MNTPFEHPIDRAARVIGSASALARLLGISKSAVSQYKDPDRQVRAEHCPVIERETRALGEVVWCEELRPDVDWSALRMTDAPAFCINSRPVLLDETKSAQQDASHA